jgi:hypothetical protein
MVPAVNRPDRQRHLRADRPIGRSSPRVRVPSPRGHAAPHPGYRRFRLKPVPAIGDSVLSIGPSARFIAGTHTLSALLAKTVARRASRQEGHGLFLGQLLVVWTC